MKQAIWKFPLGIADRQDINMPRNAAILCCQVQHGVACLWVVCDKDATDSVLRRIEILGTGHPMDECNRGYIDTFQLDDGRLVFHVFERYEPKDSDNQGVPVAESDAHAREPECGMRPVSVWHGKTCQRQEHTKGGYGHDFDDDSPYDVDGVSYCGRCHHCLDESERVDIVGPEQQADIIASPRVREEEAESNSHKSPI